MALTVDAGSMPLVCLGYADPDHSMRHCFSTKLARVRLSVLDAPAVSGHLIVYGSMRHLDIASADALRALCVRDVMTASPRTIDHASHVSEAMDLMEQANVRHLPVLRDGKLAGLLTERHVRDAMPSILTLHDPSARRRSLEVTRVHQIWIEAPVTIEPDASLLSAIAVMRRLRGGSLPVVEHGALVGIITAGDLITVLESVLRSKHA